jgi:hypothetical protein
MGKKNKKSRHHHYDDDDLLLATDHQEVNPPDIGSAKQQHTVNIDLLILEEQMTDLLRNYPGRPEDWLYRTIEKNMRLPKHSLKKSVEPHILHQMRSRVEEMIDAEEDEAESSLPDGGAKEHDKTISAEDEAKLRAEARMAGADPDEAVAAANEILTTGGYTCKGELTEDQDEQDVSKTETTDQPLAEEEVQSLQSNMTFAVSSLIALQPYTMEPSSGGAIFTRILLLLRQYLCIILCYVLSLIFGQQARQRATLIWQKVHLPLIEAELRAKKKEEDLRILQLEAKLLAEKKEEDLHMLQQNDHLWSDEEERWIEKDKVFSPPIAGDDTHTLPVTIRWNPARKQWERWSKNLTTRTKKQASGLSLTKGTFLPAREGDGWATSPNEAEIENKQLTTQSIRFFACLPSNDDTLDVVDVTSWAAKSLLPKEAARALEAVDSGKVLFSFDVSAVKRKGVGVGVGKDKQKKKNKIAKAKQTSPEDDWIAMKGVGDTAQVTERYLNKMQ